MMSSYTIHSSGDLIRIGALDVGGEADTGVTRRCARYFRFDRYLFNAKAPKARTMIERIETSPIPSILEPPIIWYMLMCHISYTSHILGERPISNELKPKGYVPGRR